ncbi:cobalamin biosynthesis protein P47K [Dehalobacter sp. DCM]|uniref:GTP-binding protein n=1 Tax=Dehalobacter sp. DCM TaxID=2907827 RepID=UPI0030813D91|nr:cobalamin biosynthesis protein P47K [Dehalobacter sp. DCM]
MNVLIIGGFLGSGKTSFIQQFSRYVVKKYCQTNPDLKVVIIENEVGTVGIDDSLLRTSGLEVKELFSGCACCTLAGDLANTMIELQKKANPEWVIMEATGIAYPKQIRQVLQDIGIDSRICVLVDASRWKRILTPLYQLLTAQLKDADVILLNKTDLVNEEQKRDIMRSIDDFNTTAERIETVAIENMDTRIFDVVMGG